MRQKLMFSKIVWQWSRILRKGCWLELKHSIELKYTMLRSVLLLAMSLFLDTSLFFMPSFIGLLSPFHIWLTSCLRSQDSVWTRVQPVRNVWHLVRFIFDLCHKRWEENIQPQPPCPSSCRGMDVLSTPLGEWSEFSLVESQPCYDAFFESTSMLFFFSGSMTTNKAKSAQVSLLPTFNRNWSVRCFGIGLICFQRFSYHKLTTPLNKQLFHAIL